MSKILIIEDDTYLSETIETLLKFEGYTTILAENGAIGIKKALEKLPDLIICDVMMPEMDGLDVIDALRGNIKTATIPFIFLTAKAELSDIRKGMSLGADDYITKPFNNDDLLNAIKIRLEKRKLLVRSVKRSTTVSKKEISSENKLKIEKITKRELEIIELFCKGLSCSQIADGLFISFHTVNSHRKNIEKKLKVHNISSIVRFAFENKLVKF